MPTLGNYPETSYDGYTTASSVWPTWVQNAIPNANYYPSTANTVWVNWVTQTTAANYQPITVNASGYQAYLNDYQAGVWSAWQELNQSFQQVGQSAKEAAQRMASLSQHRLDPEEDKRQQARVRRAQLLRRTRERSRALRSKVASRVAEELLLDHLTPAQREEWVTHRYFHVETADGRRRYRIDYGLAGNIHLVKCDEPVTGKHGIPLRAGNRFCAHVYHPDGPIPNEDNVLAQKLLLETSEEEFLAMANIS
jgi:hypothetical protein